MKFNTLLFIVFLILSTTASSFAVYNGDLDVAFNNGGYVRFGFGGGSDSGRAAVRQPDGKIVVAATTWQGARTVISVLRYMPDGSLDLTFAGGGKAYVALGEDNIEAGAVAVQPDGRILVAGTGKMLEGKDFLLARLNADGSRDFAFGAGGFAVTDFAGDDDFASAVMVQADNKIVVAGTATPVSFPFPGTEHFGVARYNADGTRDLSFNGGGKVSMEAGFANTAVLQADGKIVVGGTCYGTGRMCAVRFGQNGPVDTSFGGTGRVVVNDTGVATAASVQPDGKLVFTGYTPQQDRFDFVRLNTNGTPDGSFGQSGVAHAYFTGYTNVYALSAVLQPDGKILASGYTQPFANQSWLAAARVNADGSPDTSFDGDGRTVVSLMPNPQKIFASVLDPDGKILVVGAGSGDVLTGKLRPDGSVDTGYGNQGILVTDAGDLTSTARAMALQPDGKIVLAGTGPSVARLNADGSPDAGFNGTGRFVLTDWNGLDVKGVAVRPDEKIIVAGNSGGGFMIGRVTREGGIDPSFGNDGRVLVPSVSIASLALQTDGKIVVGGNDVSGVFTVFRFNDDGTPDRFFGRGGRVTLSIGGTLTALAVQADGKIVSAGQTLESGSMVFLGVRLNQNGSLDAGFGQGGIVKTDVTPSPDFATSIAVAPDGKIVVAGYSEISAFRHAFLVAKYNGNGSLDDTFNGAGTNMTSADRSLDRASAVAIRFDGKIIVAGNQFGHVSSSIVTVRFNANGTQDVSQWGQVGVAGANLVGDDYGVAIALDSYGRPLVAGTCLDLFCVTRFTSEFAPVLVGSVSGLVLGADGRRPATITMTDPLGNSRQIRTDKNGRYRIENVLTGGVYTFVIQQKGHTFSMRQITVSGDMVDVNFDTDS